MTPSGTSLIHAPLSLVAEVLLEFEHLKLENMKRAAGGLIYVPTAEAYMIYDVCALYRIQDNKAPRYVLCHGC